MKLTLYNRHLHPVAFDGTVGRLPIVGDRVPMPGPPHDPRPFIWEVLMVLPPHPCHPDVVTVVCGEAPECPTY